MRCACIVGFWLVSAAPLPARPEVVVPNVSAAVAYGGGARYYITEAPISYQVQVAESELAALRPGDRITGIQWRQFPNVFSEDPWPPEDHEWSSYEITLARAANPIAAMSTAFAANMVNPVTVQSGVFAIPAGAFPGGVTAPPAVNAWGALITFPSPYIYEGGDLVILVRHGPGAFVNGLNFLDTIRTTDPPAGVIRALSADSASATGGAFTNQSATVSRLTFIEGCYADCNADGATTVADFGCFQTRFVLGDMYADCNADGQLTVADFGCFQTRFVVGCP